jgi:hypothetical protein
VGSCLLWILSFAFDMMEMYIEPLVNIHFIFIFDVSMELVNACSSEPSVENVAPNDVEQVYYYPRLVDHLELRPIEISTSFGLEIETQLATASGIEALHDVGPLMFFPLTELGISQESAKSFGFANYRFQKIVNTFSFADEAPHLELVLQKIPRISSLVNASC